MIGFFKRIGRGLAQLGRIIFLTPFWKYWSGGHVQNITSVAITGGKVLSDISQSVLISLLAQSVVSEISDTVIVKYLNIPLTQEGLIWAYGMAYGFSHFFEMLSSLSLTGVGEAATSGLGNQLIIKLNSLYGEDLRLAQNDGYEISILANQLYFGASGLHEGILKETIPGLAAMIGIAVTMGMRFGWHRAGIVFGGSVFYVVFSVIGYGVFFAPRKRIVQKNFEKVTADFGKIVERKSLIEIFQTQQFEITTWQTQLNNAMNRNKKISLGEVFYRWLRSLTPTGIVIGYLYLTLIHAKKGNEDIHKKSLDDFVFFTQIMALIIASAENLSAGIMKAINKSQYLTTVHSFFNSSYPRLPETMRQEKNLLQKISEVKHHELLLEFKNVYFSYLSIKKDPLTNKKSYVRKKTVLHNINFTINKGDRVAFVGETGCGKSTILSLLTRECDLRRPKIIEKKIETLEEARNEGDINIANKNLYLFSIEEQKKCLTLIPQHPLVRNDLTLYENIAYGTANIELIQEELNNYIKIFKLEALNNFDKNRKPLPITNPSTGEKQRINFARATFKALKDNIPLIILDEPTSALDSNMEAKMMTEFLSKIDELKTIVIVAHRLTTIIHCNKINIIESGRLVEQGITNEYNSAHLQLLKKTYLCKSKKKEDKIVLTILEEAKENIEINQVDKSLKNINTLLSEESTQHIPSLYWFYWQIQIGAIFESHEIVYQFIDTLKLALIKLTDINAPLQINQMNEENNYDIESYDENTQGTTHHKYININ